MDREYLLNKIYEEVFEMLDDIFKNMCIKQNDLDDLKQEIILIVMEYDREKIIELYEKKQLKFFVVRIINNQYFSNSSPYYKKYKKYYQLVDGNIYNNKLDDDLNDDLDNDTEDREFTEYY